MSMHERESAPYTPCSGWWDEIGFGRQSMHQLKLRIACGQIAGSGIDIIGPFTLTARSLSLAAWP
jgi:hypothetical protein